MTPEEINEANALMAQVVDGYRWVCEGFRKQPLRYLMGPNGASRYTEPISDTPTDKRAYYDDKCESEPYDDWHELIPQYHTDAAALMRVEEWLAECNFQFMVCHVSEHGKKWVSVILYAQGESGGVTSNGLCIEEGYMQCHYVTCVELVKHIVEQAGSIEAAKEWEG